MINKCLPGTTHFVRVISVSPDGNILGKSRQLTVQTSAPPDAPKLAVRWVDANQLVENVLFIHEKT